MNAIGDLILFNKPKKRSTQLNAAYSYINGTRTLQYIYVWYYFNQSFDVRAQEHITVSAVCMWYIFDVKFDIVLSNLHHETIQNGSSSTLRMNRKKQQLQHTLTITNTPWMIKCAKYNLSIQSIVWDENETMFTFPFDTLCIIFRANSKLW